MGNEKIASPEVSFDEFKKPSYDEWKNEAVTALKGGDFQKKLFTKTYEGITLEPIYYKGNCKTVEQSFPGFEKYLRGTTSGGYMEKPWGIAQRVTASCPEEANRQILSELEGGADTINLRLFTPYGANYGDKDEVERLLKGVILDAVSFHVHAGGTALPGLALFDAACGIENIKGCVGADPIGAMVQGGKLPRRAEDFYDDMAAAVKFAAEKAPGLKTVLVDGAPFAEGGADAVQETAFCMAEASEYISAMLERGIDVNTAVKAIRFSFSVGANFFMEIARLRAARVVFAKLVEAYGGEQEARKIDVHAKTSSFTKTVYDPYVNILRATTEAFSGVVGGVDALEVSPLDEACGEADASTRRIARNIQIMLKEEFNLVQPVDPAGGSWYIETLTAQLAEKVWDKFKAIEKEGGLLAALKAGTVQAEIAATLEARVKKLALRSDRAVGVNMYANMLEKPLEREKDTGYKRTAAVRDEKKVAEALAKIEPARVETVRDAFAAGANGMEVFLRLPATGASELKPIVPTRWTVPFEELRAKSEAFEKETGSAIKVFLANYGPLSKYKARADFSTGFFEVGHFSVINEGGYETAEAAAGAAVKSGADVAVICSSDDFYPEAAPAIASAIKAEAPEMTVMLAGAPAPEYKDAYQAAGIDDFIHVRANCLQILTSVQRKRGIR